MCLIVICFVSGGGIVVNRKEDEAFNKKMYVHPFWMMGKTLLHARLKNSNIFLYRCKEYKSLPAVM